MIYYASAESSHFSYQAIGKTEEEARETMRLNLISHALNYDLDVNEFLEFISVSVEELKLGKGYVDGFEYDLKQAKEWSKK